MEWNIESVHDIPQVARDLVKEFEHDRCFAFEGEMGAGKTTLITEILKQLGIEDPEGSPTFSLVNTYELNNGKTVHHFDFYRVESLEEALDMGVEDLLYGDDLCLMEWPKKVEELLPDETIWLYLSIQEHGEGRILSSHE